MNVFAGEKAEPAKEEISSVSSHSLAGRETEFSFSFQPRFWVQPPTPRLGSMKRVLFLLYILGAAAAVPTNLRFVPDDFKPTADSSSPAPPAETLVTPSGTEIPIFNGEDEGNEKETSVSLEDHPNHKSKEESDSPVDLDPSDSPGLESKDQKESDSVFSENLEDTPTEGTLDPKEDTSELQKKEVPENTDFLAPDVTSVVDSDQEEGMTNTEKDQEQPISDLHPQLNRSSKQSHDLGEPGYEAQDEKSSDEEKEKEKESGEVGVNHDDQEKESKVPKKHAGAHQEQDSTKSSILAESERPTQISQMQKDETEQDNQEQEEDQSDAEIEDETSSENKKHQDSEWPNHEEKSGLEVMSNQEEMEKKTVSEPLAIEPTVDQGDIMSRNHEADKDDDNDDDDDDDHRHHSNDEDATPSQASLQSEGSQSDHHHLKNEEQREKAQEKESGDTSEPGEHQGAKKAENLPTEDGSSSEGNSRVHSADVCMNFQCKRGHMCKVNQQGKPHCVCQDPMTCPPAKPLDQVCGTDNQTYTSSCHLFATKCRMEGTKRGHQLQLDYFGACKSIPVCTDFEVTQFPLRMRDWLKNILMQLYEPNPEHNGYLNEKQRNKVKKIYLDEKRLLAGDHSIDLLLRDFKKNYHMYVYPVHWQFSELDQHPTDRVLTHSELAPLRASLVPMEHCITRFFEECDPNKDKHITLKEWGHCFGIKEEDIDENLLF